MAIDYYGYRIESEKKWPDACGGRFFRAPLIGLINDIVTIGKRFRGLNEALKINPLSNRTRKLMLVALMLQK